MLEQSTIEFRKPKIEDTLRIRDCGLAEYREILQLQHELREKRRKGKIPNTVLIAEHPAVITLGARQSSNKLRASREDLAQRHIDVVDIRRGGGTTAHNPGQLVFYPILHLQQLGLGISEYIRELEAIGTELLEQLGVVAHRRRGFPGLWVTEAGLASSCVVRDASCEKEMDSRLRGNDKTQYAIRSTQYAIRKIASIGVRVSKFVTYHGMAINIQNDLSIFDFIAPCGLDDIEMTSVLKETEAGCEGSRRRFENKDVFNSETGEYYSMSQVKERLSQLLIRHLS